MEKRRVREDYACMEMYIKVNGININLGMEFMCGRMGIFLKAFLRMTCVKEKAFINGKMAK